MLQPTEIDASALPSTKPEQLHQSERECLKLVFAVLWRASERWRRVQFSEHERKQLERYMEERQRQRAARKEAPAATVA
ncbi:MAG: hypothetical protein C4297_15010 [Gemmataceae bacterium]